jgi:hypothetical protein
VQCAYGDEAVVEEQVEAAGARRRGAELGGEELGEERNERADEVHKCSGSL